MTQTKTKKALLMSVLSMVLCVAMLVGMTFAWFTDTASTAVNKIESGKLDVELVDENGAKLADNHVLTWIAKDGRTQDQILWEPNCKYNLEVFGIRNAGNLALKYKVILKATDIDAKDGKTLLDVIDWTIKVGDETLTVTSEQIKNGLKNGIEIITDRPLAKETTDSLIAVTGQMRSDAGNDYQGLSINGFGVEVYATQLNSESDSYSPNYDKDATYPVMNVEGLKTSLADGGSYVLSSDVAIAPEVADKNANTLAPQMTVTKDTVLDLSDKKLGVDANDDFGKASPVLMAVTGGTLTINGKGTIDCEAGNQQVYGINVNGGKVVINDGKYYGALTAVQVQQGSLEINGGFFDMAPTCKAQVPQYAKYVINCIDRYYKDGTATISIKGGTFVNFDPSANPEGDGTSYVADGYKVVSETQTNGDIWYTVVAE